MQIKLLLLFCLVFLSQIIGCGEKKPEITAGVDACSVCNMVIDQTNQACGFVDGIEFKPFDSPGCLLRQIDNLKRNGLGLPTEIFFADFEGSGLHSSGITTFLLTDHLPTVMNGRVLTFSNENAAREMSKFPDEVITNFKGYITQRGNPDMRIRVELKSDSISPDVISVEKGDIVEWVYIGKNIESDVKIRIQGYEELGEINVPAGEEPVRIRMLAEHPGSGFPIIRVSDGKALGMLKVSGAHTKEEESM